MEPKDIIREIRKVHHLTQEQMAEELGVTRQAVSRWETGSTWPNPEMLKTISRLFNVSADALLGSIRTRYFQCVSESQNPSESAMKRELWKWMYDNYSNDFLEEIIELIRNADSFDGAVSEMSNKYGISADVAKECLNLPFLEISTIDKQFCKKEWLKYSSGESYRN